MGVRCGRNLQLPQVATLASIVASQALITGVFTVLKQASTLGLFPFLGVTHTSHLYEHQVYSSQV